MEKAEAYDERFEEVGWGRTTCEGGEQGSASFCGVAGGKGLNQGESGLPKHVPNPVSGKRATGGGPDTESFCRQSPEVGAGWFNDHVRICAGGAQQCAFLPQPRGVRRNPYSYRNWEPRVGNHPRPPGRAPQREKSSKSALSCGSRASWRYGAAVPLEDRAVRGLGQMRHVERRLRRSSGRGGIGHFPFRRTPNLGHLPVSERERADAPGPALRLDGCLADRRRSEFTTPDKLCNRALDHPYGEFNYA